MAKDNEYKASPRRRGGAAPTFGPMLGPVQKAKNQKAALRRLVQFLGPYRVSILLALLMTMASTVFSILGPRQFGNATTLLSEGLMGQITGGEGIDFTALGSLMLRLVFIYGASALFWWLSAFILAKVAAQVSYNMRNTIMQKVNRMPIAYFNKNSYGDVLSRITNDVDVLGQSLNQGVSQLLYSGAMILGIIVMMFSSSWQLALTAVTIIPVMIGLSGLIIKKSQKFFKNQQKFLGTVNGHVEETYAGHTVVKAYGGETEVIAAFDVENEKLYRANWRAHFLSGLLHPMVSFMSNLNYVAVCVLGAYLAATGRLPIGRIVEFILYVRQFNQPMMQLAQMMNVFQQTAAAAERVFEFLDEEEETLCEEQDAKLPNVAGYVEFRNVRFGYEGCDEIVIHDFSARVKAGQKVAIVGPTGGGKTTLVKLLMRFHDLHSGQILIDGHNIASYPRSEIRAACGMVLQDTWLTNASIADNIRYGNLNATDDEVKAAAKAAQAHSFIRALPEGYRMIINEEANNISQGQKQLLTIARAVLADSRILILDEATSSVDTRTEILIQKAMDRLMEGRTSFIIAHRLSTIRNADLILCLDKGDIVEQGTHEELLAKGGFYARLYNSQFERVGA